MYENLKNKKLLILGGMRINCEIVKCAKMLGIITCVADYFNDYKKSPAKKIADYEYLIDITDVDSVVELIKKENIDGVITGFNDMLLPYYSEICKKSGLPCYGTTEQFELFIDKNKWKKLFKKFGINTPERYEFDENIKYPVLIKPSDSSGSRGISVCNNEKELLNAKKHALDYSKTKSITIEQYIDTEEATIFWLFVDGDCYLTGIADRYVRNDQGTAIPLPVAYTYPSSLTHDFIRKDLPKYKNMFSSVGIKNGMMFMQCKIYNNDLYVYDVGYRLTGTLEYKIFSKCCGYNPLEMMINYSLTGKMCESNSALLNVDPYLKGFRSLDFQCVCKLGRIRAIKGIKEILENESIIDCYLSHVPGEKITKEMKGLLSQVTARIFAVTKTKNELLAVINDIDKNIDILNDEENSMRLPSVCVDAVSNRLL